MKTLFVPASVKDELNYERISEEIKIIPHKNIALCYSSQFVEVSKKIEKFIDKKVLNRFQILGCSNPKFDKRVEAILVIGQGDFHPVSIAYESGLPTYVLERERLRKVSSEDVRKLEKRQKGSLLKYLNSKRVGIIVTNKPGQERIDKALKFKRSLENKKGYLFMANDINVRELENFPGIDSWVNTACPRLDLDEFSILNLEILTKFLKPKKQTL